MLSLDPFSWFNIPRRRSLVSSYCRQRPRSSPVLARTYLRPGRRICCGCCFSRSRTRWLSSTVSPAFGKTIWVFLLSRQLDRSQYLVIKLEKYCLLVNSFVSLHLGAQFGEVLPLGEQLGVSPVDKFGGLERYHLLVHSLASLSHSDQFGNVSPLDDKFGEWSH